MRRNPFVSALLTVAAASLLLLPVFWPLLSIIARPEVLLSVLFANIALTLIAARIIRKSLASRISNLAAQTEDELKRLEARQQSLIRRELQALEGRIMASMRILVHTASPNSNALAEGIADRLAKATSKDAPANPEAPGYRTAKTDPTEERVLGAHPKGTNGSSDIRDPESSPPGSATGDESAEAGDPTVRDDPRAPTPDLT